jgi:hypothetical protein
VPGYQTNSLNAQIFVGFAGGESIQSQLEFIIQPFDATMRRDPRRLIWSPMKHDASHDHLVIRQLKRPKGCASGSNVSQLSAIRTSHCDGNPNQSVVIFSDFDRLIRSARQTLQQSILLAALSNGNSPPQNSTSLELSSKLAHSLLIVSRADATSITRPPSSSSLQLWCH